MERSEKVLDAFLLGPEVAVKRRYIGNRAGSLLGHQFRY
jgi:hypothetical protein